MMLYNIPAFDGVTEFLVEVARGKGRLKRVHSPSLSTTDCATTDTMRQGGVPDLDGTAVSILRDWVSGRIPYYTSPPAAAPAGTLPFTPAASTLENVSDADVDSATLLTSFAPAFDLAALFGEADALAFGEMGEGTTGKRVRMDGFEEDSADANVGWVTEEADEEEDDMADDSNIINVDDLLEDDEDDDDVEENDDEMEEDMIPTLLAAAEKAAAAPKGRKTNIVSVAPSNRKNKSVSFASKPLGPTSQTSKLFAANDVEAPVTLNKDIKKNAKKNAKKARRAEGRMDVEAEEEMSAAPAKPRASATTGGAYSFEEFFPSAGAKGGKGAGSAMDVDE